MVTVCVFHMRCFKCTFDEMHLKINRERSKKITVKSDSVNILYVSLKCQTVTAYDRVEKNRCSIF